MFVSINCVEKAETDVEKLSEQIGNGRGMMRIGLTNNTSLQDK